MCIDFLSNVRKAIECHRENHGDRMEAVLIETIDLHHPSPDSPERVISPSLLSGRGTSRRKRKQELTISDFFSEFDPSSLVGNTSLLSSTVSSGDSIKENGPTANKRKKVEIQPAIKKIQKEKQEDPDIREFIDLSTPPLYEPTASSTPKTTPKNQTRQTPKKPKREKKGTKMCSDCDKPAGKHNHSPDEGYGFKCPNCPRSFKKFSTIYRHLKTVHGMESSAEGSQEED